MHRTTDTDLVEAVCSLCYHRWGVRATQRTNAAYIVAANYGLPATVALALCHDGLAWVEPSTFEAVERRPTGSS